MSLLAHEQLQHDRRICFPLPPSMHNVRMDHAAPIPVVVNYVTSVQCITDRVTPVQHTLASLIGQSAQSPTLTKLSEGRWKLGWNRKNQASLTAAIVYHDMHIHSEVHPMIQSCSMY